MENINTGGLERKETRGGVVQNERLIVSMIAKKGAGLDRIWSSIQKELHESKYDVVFIYGGVCDLTDLKYDEKRVRFVDLPLDMESRVVAICDKMDYIAAKFKLLDPMPHLSFIMEAGLDLIAYNRISSPVPRIWIEKQEKLEHYLPSLHEKAKMLNCSLGSQTAWTLDATHARRGRHMSPVYSRLPDGLHPNEVIATKLARAIQKATSLMLRPKSNEEGIKCENNDLPVSPR